MVGHIILAYKYIHQIRPFSNNQPPLSFSRQNMIALKNQFRKTIMYNQKVNHEKNLTRSPLLNIITQELCKKFTASSSQRLILLHNFATLHISLLKKKPLVQLPLYLTRVILWQRKIMQFTGIFFTPSSTLTTTFYIVAFFFFEKKGVTTIKYCFREYRFLVSRRCRTDVF